eukprot:6180407-Pleurochrysis_carterae.AAC.5
MFRSTHLAEMIHSSTERAIAGKQPAREHGQSSTCSANASGIALCQNADRTQLQEKERADGARYDMHLCGRNVGPLKRARALIRLVGVSNCIDNGANRSVSSSRADKE